MRLYQTIVADPPWPLRMNGPFTTKRGGNWSGEVVAKAVPYPTMTLEAIAALPVGDMADDDAHLYVWTTNGYLERTYEIVRAWGFHPGTLLTWCKAPMGKGLGGAFASTTEHVLTARRGSLPNTARIDRQWWEWKRGVHSAKPEAFMDLVEQVSPGPYLEMFSRRARLGWDVWGNEVDSHVQLEPTT